MELDTKERVLLALYTEYQKDLPNMKGITHQVLELEQEVFNVALDKLENEGLIHGVKFTRVAQHIHPVTVWIDGCKLTPRGIHYVETKLSIEPTMSNKEKVQKVLTELGKWGLEQAKDVIAKIGAELISKSVNNN